MALLAAALVLGTVALLAAVLVLGAPALASAATRARIATPLGTATASAATPARIATPARTAKPSPPTPAQELARTAKATTPKKAPTPKPPTTTSTPTLAPGPLVWAAPVAIDANPLDGISCPSVSLCVAVDSEGRVLSSSDPSAGARAWSAADVDGPSDLAGIACPSVSVCVAVDGAGDVVSTGNASSGPGAAWSVAKVDTTITEPSSYGGGSDLLRGVSCPSVSFCLAVDAVGNVVFSGAPTGGASTWVLVHVDDNSDYGCAGGGLMCQAPLMGVSCPTVTLCAAADFTGNVLETATPTAATVWASRATGEAGPQALWTISCPSVSLCATVNGTGGDAITWDPAEASQLTAHRLPIDAFGLWCSSSALCLAAGEGSHGAAELIGTTDPTAKSPTWNVTDYGDVNGVSCPTKSTCVAVDNEGDAIAGVTVAGLEATLRAQAIGGRIPKIGPLVRRSGYSFTFTSPLAGQLQVTWELTGAAARAAGDTSTAPLVLATGAAHFTGAQSQTVHLTVNGAGKRVLMGAKRFTLTALAGYETNTGLVSAERKLTLR